MGRRPAAASATSSYNGTGGTSATATNAAQLLEADSTHRAFLAKSLCRNDVELAALEKLHGQILELRALIVEKYGEQALFPPPSINSTIAIDKEQQVLLTSFKVRLQLRRRLLNRLSRRLNRVAHFMDGDTTNVLPPAPPKYGDVPFQLKVEEAQKQAEEQATAEALRLKFQNLRASLQSDLDRYSFDSLLTCEQLTEAHLAAAQQFGISTQELQQLKEMDVGYEKVMITTTVTKNDKKTVKTVIKPIALDAANNQEDDDDDEGPEYLKINSSSRGIGSTARSSAMSVKEKEMEFARWSQELLARVVEQPTFEDLGMGLNDPSNVFYLDERRAKALLIGSQVKSTREETLPAVKSEVDVKTEPEQESVKEIETIKSSADSAEGLTQTAAILTSKEIDTPPDVVISKNENKDKGDVGSSDSDREDDNKVDEEDNNKVDEGVDDDDADDQSEENQESEKLVKHSNKNMKEEKDKKKLKKDRKEESDTDGMSEDEDSNKSSSAAEESNDEDGDDSEKEDDASDEDDEDSDEDDEDEEDDDDSEESESEDDEEKKEDQSAKKKDDQKHKNGAIVSSFLKKRARLSLQPVPSFGDQDLKRIKAIQAHLVQASVHEQSRKRIDEATEEYNATVKNSTELQGLKIRLQQDLSKVNVAARSRVQKIRNDFALEVAIARAKWTRQKEDWESAKRARLYNRLHGRISQNGFGLASLEQFRDINNPYNPNQTARTSVIQCFQGLMNAVEQRVAATGSRRLSHFNAADAASEVAKFVGRTNNINPQYPAHIDLNSPVFPKFQAPPAPPELDPGFMAQQQDETEKKLQRQIIHIEEKFNASEEERKRAWRKLQKLKNEYEHHNLAASAPVAAQQTPTASTRPSGTTTSTGRASRASSRSTAGATGDRTRNASTPGSAILSSRQQPNSPLRVSPAMAQSAGSGGALLSRSDAAPGSYPMQTPMDMQHPHPSHLHSEESHNKYAGRYTVEKVRERIFPGKDLLLLIEFNLFSLLTASKSLN